MANIKYNKTIEKTILNRLCNGESIRKICKDPTMVSWATFSQKLKDSEKELGQPKRINLYQVKKGDTFKSLSYKTSFSTHAENRLRVINLSLIHI
mgnify:CR=1 FL=1